MTIATGGRGSPGFIGSEATIAAARAALGAALPGEAACCEAVLLGCFGDLGLDRLRRAIGRPIVSLSDACYSAAPLLPHRLAIITTSAFWVERFGADVARRGLESQIVAIKAVPASPDQLAELAPACRAAIAELAAAGEAEAIVLGGALLEVLRTELIIAGTPLPIINTLAIAVELCRALAGAAATAFPYVRR